MNILSKQLLLVDTGLCIDIPLSEIVQRELERTTKEVPRIELQGITSVSSDGPTKKGMVASKRR